MGERAAPSITVTNSERRRAIVAGAIGNFVEWYDFIAYGALAVVLAPLFFPSSSETASLLGTFAAFGIAFVFRPMGGIVWGYIGDRWGRRTALSSAIIVMSGATMIIGLLPTVGSIGILAPILLVLARLVQGLAAGSEWSGSAVFLVEYGDKKKRAFFASMTPSGAWLGSAAGVALVALLTAVLGSDAMAEWGWRIPFLLAGPLGAVGFYLRLRLSDTPAFQQLQSAKAVERAPVRDALKRYWKQILVVFIGAAAQSTVTYTLVAFMVTYLTTQVGVTLGTALLTNTLALCVGTAATLVSGVIADRIGRKPVYLTSAAALILLAVPMFLLIANGDFASVLIGQCVLAIFLSGMLGPIAVLCVELFPARVRYAASAVGYSIGAGVIGGVTPLIATALIAASGSALAPAFYMTGVLIVAFVALLVMLKETVHLQLDKEEEAVVDDLGAVDSAAPQSDIPA